MTLEPPWGLLAELTHRCPLQCPYCSNPLELQKANVELPTETWQRVFDEAAELGVLQLHLSGGEPTLRRDLEDLVAHAREVGLYTNLITAGVLLDEARLDRLAEAGLDHVQISLQGAEPSSADRVAGYRGAHGKKLALARMIRARDLPLTINAVIHRQNIAQLGAIIELAVELGAHRIEIAHTQYYGWALLNRAALMPSRAQVEQASAVAEAARERHAGRLVIDYVVPDYYARRPKPCMGGWGRQMLAVTPGGDVMPCQAAAIIPGLTFDNVRERSLGWTWAHSEAFNHFRGTAWMRAPCRTCPLREVDWGGCRCQAMALADDPRATDPACELSPLHARMTAVAEAESGAEPPPLVYRRPLAEPPVSRARLADA
jgi:pyrroloquinoline quinone biosynthesis protein E